MAYFTDETKRAAEEAVRRALSEDLGAKGDITSAAMIPAALAGTGSFVFKEAGVVAGVVVLEEVCRQISKRILIEVLKGDGEAASAGETALRIFGPARELLAAERTALNFISHLSGVATMTRDFVKAVKGTKALIYDTRKTLPGLRALEKYAVRCGGGKNHRMGLYDQVLVKDNHIALSQDATRRASLAEVLIDARRNAPQGVLFEVEATTIAEVEAAVAAGADIVMLDNMTPATIRRAVAIAGKRQGRKIVFEASGGVTLRTVAKIAATGVDRISVGAITHSARWIDISLEIE